ncbi:hypothetical protein GCM10027577_17560 [Spirosoma fluminis]
MTISGIEIILLYKNFFVEFLQPCEVAFKVVEVSKVDTLNVSFLPSYSPMLNLFYLLRAKFTDCKTILMNESCRGTEKANVGGKLLKCILVRFFNTSSISRIPQVEYVQAYGQKSFNVYSEYYAIDVAYLDAYWINFASQLPSKILSERYFLNLGRFVPKRTCLY